MRAFVTMWRLWMFRALTALACFVPNSSFWFRPPCPNVSASNGFTRRCSRSEEHTSELQSLMRISYAVFCFTKILFFSFFFLSLFFFFLFFFFFSSLFFLFFLSLLFFSF